MSLMILFFVGILNMVLQTLSRNLLFFFAFVFMICAAIVLTFKESRSLFAKLFAAATLLGGLCLLTAAICRHILVGVYVWDYLLIAIETAAALLLMLLSLLPEKNNGSPDGESR